MARSKIKPKAIKLPKVLIQLGRAVEVRTDERVFKWTAKSGCNLWCSATGKTLYCLVTTVKDFSKADLERAVQRSQDTVDAGMKLYEKWSEFDPCSGSLGTPPRGFLHHQGRAQSIIYSSDKWVGTVRKYIHEFKKPPVVWANKKSEPTLLVLSGGHIRVEKRGIVG
jgi:hypothetical protein